MPVVEQQTHVVTADVLAEGVNLAKYGVKRVSLVIVSVEAMSPAKETYMENIVTKNAFILRLNYTHKLRKIFDIQR